MVVHKTRHWDNSGEANIDEYVSRAIHNIPCNPKSGYKKISYYWEDVTCKYCLKTVTSKKL